MLFLLTAAVTLVSDQVSKAVVLNSLSPARSVPVFPGIFHLTLVHNTGIAFGFFNDHPSLLLALITASLVLLLFWGLSLRGGSVFQQLAAGMILGGAAGNWLDRLRFGAVTDFLDFRVWPVFNLADSAITVAVGILILLLIREKK